MIALGDCSPLEDEWLEALRDSFGSSVVTVPDPGARNPEARQMTDLVVMPGRSVTGLTEGAGSLLRTCGHPVLLVPPPGDI